MKERLIDGDGIINVGAFKRFWQHPHLEPAQWMCGVCRRIWMTETQAKICADSHPKDAPPTNEDR